MGRPSRVSKPNDLKFFNLSNKIYEKSNIKLDSNGLDHGIHAVPSRYGPALPWDTATAWILGSSPRTTG